MLPQAGHSGNHNKEIVMLFWLPVSCLGHLPSFCEVSYHRPIPESESKTGAAVAAKNTIHCGSLSRAFLVLTFPRIK